MLVGITLLTFVLSHAVPADPVTASLGEQAAADPAVVAAFRREWGLDRSLPEQYGVYLWNLARGNFGVSISTRQPVWLDLRRGDLWGTIAIQDHGPQSFVYEDRQRVPLGANMAATRGLFERIGVFRGDLGRSSGKRVMGQEVPELLARARAAGFRGVYQPAMHVAHHVPAARLTRSPCSSASRPSSRNTRAI